MTSGTSNPVRYFGRQVRKARLAAGWTLAEFGQRIGYDPGQVSRIENGRRPATELFAQMCHQAFPERGGWFSEFYAESRTWIATPPCSAAGSNTSSTPELITSRPVRDSTAAARRPRGHASRLPQNYTYQLQLRRNTSTYSVSMLAPLCLE